MIELKERTVNILKKKNKLLVAALVIVTIVILNVIIAVVYRPIGPALIIDAYLKCGKVEKRFEDTYKDDDFRLLYCSINREDVSFLPGAPYGYTYVFKSKKCDNEEFFAVTDFKIKNIADNYLDVRYKNKINTLIENSIDSYFGKGHYSYYLYEAGNDHIFYSTHIEKPDIYFYIEHAYASINIIVDSSFKTEEQTKIENEIINNVNSTFDTESTDLDICIIFDKKDEIDIPNKKVLTSTEFSDYRNKLYAWDKELYIQIEQLKGSEYSVLKQEWIINDKETFHYKTKNEFLNGAKATATIKGYKFSLDGSITLNELLSETDCVLYTGYVDGHKDAKDFNPNVVSTEELLDKNNTEPRIIIKVVNKTKNNTEVENGSIYAITIGDMHKVEAEAFKNCYVCGLEIGNTTNEQDLVNMFGPYEEKKINDYGDITYHFVDGTLIGYPTVSYYSRHFYVTLQGGLIKQVYLSNFEPNNNYDN